MDDKQIVALYWERSETAIAETEKKYGKYCHYIARSILYSDRDAEECVNDTYQKAWETMPPKKPERLSAYLGKLARHIAINRYIYERAQKRTPDVEAIFTEAEEFIPDPAVGDPDSGIAPGTAFEDIPDTWNCPACGVGKDSFIPEE